MTIIAKANGRKKTALSGRTREEAIEAVVKKEEAINGNNNR